MPNDFDENGNMRRAQIFPSGIDKIKQALGIVPPAMIYFVGSSQPGSILEALKTPNKDVDFASIAYLDQMQKVFGQYADAPMPRTMTGMQIMAEMAARQMPVYTGPDMNEVDAALEAIERMEE